ncbi:hypothetical protein ACQ33O_03385 [Ferruginibacter sp. SUN002]|uniref:hypothetical protein n=1 Tax=Ferruginibacter sp. SUN002 TaxID=2937789 RepID=UPI003D367A85
MKRSALLCLLLLISTTLFAQRKDSVKNSIRLKVEAINKEKNYKTISLDQLQFMENGSDGGGSVTGYFKDNRLVKIVRWIGVSYGFFVDEFYLDKDKLIFVHDIENMFEYNDSTGEINYRAIVMGFDGRYWFNAGRKIDESSLGHNRFDGDEANAEKEFLADVKKYIPLLYKKYKLGKK